MTQNDNHRQADLDLTNPNLFFYKVEYDNKRFSSYQCNQFDESIIQKGCVYELVPMNRPVIEYYDIDVEPFIIESADDAIGCIVQNVLTARNDVYKPSLQIDDCCVAYRITDKPMNRKLGIRIYSKRTFFKNNAVQYASCKAIRYEFDRSVYNKNSILNIFGSCKYKYKVPLQAWSQSTFTFANTILTQQDFANYTLVECTEPVHVKPSFQDIPKDIPELVIDFLKDHPEFSVDPANHQRFVRNQPSKCFLPKHADHVHDSDGAWWVESPDSDILVFCHRHEQSIKLINKMDLFDNNVPDKSIWRTLNIDTRYIGNLREKIASSPECALAGYGVDDGFDCAPCDLMVLRCPLGAGKSRSTIEYATKHERVLFITHRISLIRNLIADYSGEYGFKSYEDKEWEAPRLICCINSLQSVKKPLQYNVIIIDELSGVLRQFEQKSFPRKSMEAFHSIITTHRQLCVMDGTLSESDLNFFVNVVQPKIPLVVKYTYETPICKSVVIHKKLQTLADMVTHQVASGEPFMVCFSCSVCKIRAFIETTGIDSLKYLLIHKDNKSDDVLDHAFWEQHQVVLYSPCISEGVSWQGEKFKKLFGVFSKASSPPRTCVQQIGRPRLITDVNIYVDDASHKIEIQFFGGSFYKFIKSTVKDAVQSTHLDFSFDLWKKNTSETVHDYMHFDECLRSGLKENGYIVSDGVADDRKTEFNTVFAEACTKSKTEHHQSILDAVDITEEDYKKLQKESCTEAESYMVLKYRLKHELLVCDELTENTTQYFDDAYKIATLRNSFNLVFDQISGNTDLDIVNHLENRIVKNQSGYRAGRIFTDQKSYLSFTPHKILYINRLVQAMGWTNIFDTKPCKIDWTCLWAFLETRNNTHMLARCADTNIANLKKDVGEKNHTVCCKIRNAMNILYMTTDTVADETYLRPVKPVGMEMGCIPMVKNCGLMQGRDVESLKVLFAREHTTAKSMITCDRCGKEMRGDHMERHLKGCEKEKISKSVSKALAKCDTCGKEMRKDTLKRHTTTCK